MFTDCEVLTIMIFFDVIAVGSNGVGSVVYVSYDLNKNTVVRLVGVYFIVHT